MSADKIDVKLSLRVLLLLKVKPPKPITGQRLFLYLEHAGGKRIMALKSTEQPESFGNVLPPSSLYCHCGYLQSCSGSYLLPNHLSCRFC